MLPTTSSLVSFDDLADKYRGLAAFYDQVPGMVDGAALCRLIVADISALLRGEVEAPIKLAEAAERTGYSKDHLRRLIREEKLKSHRLGRIHYVRLNDIPKKPGALLSRPLADAAPSAAPEQTQTADIARGPAAPRTLTLATPAPTGLVGPKGATGPARTSLDVEAPSAYDPTADARQIAALRGRGRSR